MIGSLLMRQQTLGTSPQVNAHTADGIAPVSPPTPEMGPRLQLTYEQWVDLLAQEARAAAENQPPHLQILLGDSISLWFPHRLLPADRTWLNQGISGETTAGLLNRLDLLDQTEPEVIFLMIGINDLLRDISRDTILANQREIIRYLRQTHPDTRIVVQAILPHSAEQATWEGRDRLLQLPNADIQDINEALEGVALEEGAEFLDLYALFADLDGNLPLSLSTDGLHLSEEGYLVWRMALERYGPMANQF
jgi:lysophospholipase L1-like esterase